MDDMVICLSDSGIWMLSCVFIFSFSVHLTNQSGKGWIAAWRKGCLWLRSSVAPWPVQESQEAKKLNVLLARAVFLFYSTM